MNLGLTTATSPVIGRPPGTFSVNVNSAFGIGRYFAAAWLSALLACCIPVRVSAQTPAISQAREVLNLSRAEADLARPVRLKGIVTCWDPRSVLLFVQDESAGIYVYSSSFREKLSVGDLVQVEGVTAAGRYSPIVHWAKVNRLGAGQLPEPRNVAIEELATGQHDSQWVQIEGVIRRMEPDFQNLNFEVSSGTSRLRVHLLDASKTNLNVQTDARVKVRGVVCTRYNARDQVNGFQLIAQDLSHVTVLESAPEDVFASPPVLLKDLLAYSRRNLAEHRVHVQGTVLLHHPGRRIIIRDASGAVRVETSGKVPLQPGDVVDVAGFAAPVGYTPMLEQAIYRKAGVSKLSPALEITAGQAMSGNYDNELVRMRAVLIAKEKADSGASALVMEAGNKVFRVRADGLDDWNWRDLVIGSTLELTGVCEVTADAKNGPTGFSLLLPPNSNPVVIETPSWHKLARLALFSALAGAVALAALLAASLMRRRVARQTEIIRRRELALEERYRDLFENANDIIYGHDLNGRLTFINRAGEQVLGYTGAELLGMNITDLIVPEQKSHVRLQMDRKLAGAARTSYELDVLTGQGRRVVLEVSSRLHFEEGKLIGIKGIARDISGRKEAEAALRQSEQQLRQSMEERERLGRDLHDSIIQSIYAVGLSLEDCRRSLRQDTNEFDQRLRCILGSLNDVIRDVRNFILGLESDVLRGQEFKAALKSLVLTMGEAHLSRFAMQVDTNAAEGLTSLQATQLLHVAREAMSNSLRHSEAKRTTLSLSGTGEHLRFEVQDDGVGFNPESAAGQGHGLRNMAARAATLGAAFRVISQVGEGTRIMLDIPRTSKPQNQNA